MRCEIAVDIDSCPEHVWAVLIDLGRWPRWTTAVREATLVGGGTLGLGAVARLRAPRLPERTWHVRDFQPRRHRLALHGEGLGGRASVRFVLSRVAGTVSRSRLVVTHERSGWLGTPMARVTARTTEAHLRTLGDDLKAHCESRRRAGVAAVTG
jgi:hypothetical protein